ncbi:hypothetical protein [Cysteiniphilum litorale]|uniref:Uncharacterized protein n=2 Tax=Cysteiniphilum TaxID=2056696 RepID=A0A8J2Z2T1_9GAMM|nr:hypothetical protein [Cysteiniphilum litorale]GGF92131.1 hypothetical protein GCM10010995_06640 [Cysteiniphilum litorale]
MPSEYDLKIHENIIADSILAIDTAIHSMKSILSNKSSRINFKIYQAENVNCQNNLDELSIDQIIDLTFSYMNDDCLKGGDTISLIGYILIPTTISTKISSQIHDINNAKVSIANSIAKVKSLYNNSSHYLTLFKSTRFHKRINWKMLNRGISLIKDECPQHLTFYCEQNVVSKSMPKESLIEKLISLKKSNSDDKTHDISVISESDQEEFYIRYPRASRYAVNIYFINKSPKRIICSTPIFVISDNLVPSVFNQSSPRKKRSDAGEYEGPIINSMPVYIKK